MVAERIGAAEETFHAPHLIDLEILQVLRRYVRARELAPERAREAVEDFSQLRVERYAHDLLLWRIWELRDT
jgi:predicted nucleic acid-binding protein